MFVGNLRSRKCPKINFHKKSVFLGTLFYCYFWSKIVPRLLKQYFNSSLIEAGCDEAGRGCLAGPVYAAAVILPADFYHPLLNDSKQVKEKDREQLRAIIEKEAIAWAVCSADLETIERVNILNASMGAMHQAISQLKVIPNLLLVDGHIFPPYLGISHRCVVKGDAEYASIAAASILAKTHRDEYMYRIHNEYPQYNWNENKGYATASHRKSIATYGICKYHRKTFGICNTAPLID